MQTGMVTDEDIDAIIAKGEADTAALNNKLQEYTENAMKFTMDGGASLHFTFITNCCLHTYNFVECTHGTA